MFISHDEHLVRGVANRIVHIQDGVATDYQGDYDYFLYKSGQVDINGKPTGEEVGAHKMSKRDSSLDHPDKLAAAQEKRDAKKRAIPVNKMGVRASGGNAGAATKGSAPKPKEQKRAEAEARNRVYRALKKERERVAQIEEQMERDEKRHAELLELMADEALYADKDRFDEAMKEYNELQQRMPAMEAEWLELSATIEVELKRIEEGN